MRSSWALVGLVLVAATVIYFAPFLFRGEHAVAFNLEQAASTGIPGGELIPRTAGRFLKDNSPVVIHYPNAVLAAQSLGSGELPTWNPYTGCGAPALGGGQVYPFSVFFWPFYGHPTPWMFTLGLILGSLWAGLGAALWMKRFVSGWALGLGAALWVFNPWTVRCLGFNNTWADWWLGWILWSWHLAIERGGRYFVLPAVFMAGSVYCGHPESAFLLAAGSMVYALAIWLAQDKNVRRPALSLAGSVALTGVLALLLTAVHWAPLLANLAESATYKSQGPSGRPFYPFGALFNPHSELYLDPVLFSLALLGLIALGRSRKGRPALLLFGLGLIAAVRLPFLGLIRSLTSLGGLLPGIYARSIFWMALSLAVALGMQSLAEAPKALRLQGIRLAVLGAVAYAVLAWADYQSGGMAFLLIRKDLLVWAGVAALFLALALVSRHGGLARAGFWGAALMLVLVPLAIQRFQYPLFNALDPLQGGPPAISQFKALPGASHGRMVAGTGGNRERSWLEPNLATLWRVRDVRMVSPVFLRRYAELPMAIGGSRRSLDTWLTFEDVPPVTLGLLGVDYRAELQNAASATFRWLPQEGVLSRAYLVHEVLPVSGEEEAKRLLTHLASQFPGGDLGDGAILEGWRGPASVGHSSATDHVEWIEDGLTRVRLQTSSEAGCVLVLLDTFASGWKVTVDGHPAPIYPANLAFRAVEVPSGEHEVDFRYLPASVTGGLILTGLGWLVAASLVFWRKFPRVGSGQKSLGDAAAKALYHQSRGRIEGGVGGGPQGDPWVDGR